MPLAFSGRWDGYAVCRKWSGDGISRLGRARECSSWLGMGRGHADLIGPHRTCLEGSSWSTETRAMLTRADEACLQ